MKSRIKTVVLSLALAFIFTITADVTAAGMKINLRTTTGQMITIDADPTDTIESIKAKVQDKEGIPPEQQNFIFLRTPLEDKKTLADYKITAGATIQLVLRLR